MNLNRPNMTEDVKSKDYTNKFLQTGSNPVTMEASGIVVPWSAAFQCHLPALAVRW